MVDKNMNYYISKTAGYAGIVCGTLLFANGLISQDSGEITYGFASFSTGALILPIKEENISEKKKKGTLEKKL